MSETQIQHKIRNDIFRVIKYDSRLLQYTAK